eukprot:COSAG02_NODE_4599_length_5179_cov_13.153543_7_plen_72_part_00
MNSLHLHLSRLALELRPHLILPLAPWTQAGPARWTCAPGREHETLGGTARFPSTPLTMAQSRPYYRPSARV